MQLAKVIGNLVVTLKDDNLHGFKLMVLQPLTPDGSPVGRTLIAVDAAGAGSTAGVDASWLADAAAVGFRVAALSAIFAGFGFALASVGRNTAVALGVMVTVALAMGRSKSTWSHCPRADCSEFDTQLVEVSPSMAAAGPVAGATLGSAVESAAELDTVIRPPGHFAYTSSVPGAG